MKVGTAFIAAMFVGGAPAVFAQSPAAPVAGDIAAIRKLIQSNVLSEQAWGAWFAGQTQRKELIPDLLQLGSVPPPESDRTTMALTGVVLDALVQLKAVPDPAWTMQFFERWPVESLILLSHAGDQATPALFELTKTQKGLRWLAAANLLVTRRPSGWAAILLDGLAIDGRLFIREPNVTAIRGRVDRSAATGIWSPPPPGFPPSVHYHLTETPQPMAMVLAPGTLNLRTIHYMRNVYPPGQQYPSSWTDRTAPTAQDRLDHLAALRTNPGSERLRALESKTLARERGVNLDQDVKAYRAELTQRYERLVQALIAEGLLTDAEAKAVRVTITVTVQEQR